MQIGTDPRWAVRLGGLGRAEVRLLSSLSDIDQLPLEQLAHSRDVPAGRLQEIRDALDRTRVVAPSVENRRGTDRVPVPARLGDDLQVRSLLDDAGDGAAVLGARAARAVRVEGLGRTGTVLATALAAAGVGTIVLVDPRMVGPSEPGVGGMRERDVARPREEVAARLLADLAPGVSTALAPGEDVDVVVLVDSYATDPERAAAWRESGVTVLPVVVREADAVVGPVVRPRGGPCLRCVGLTMSDVDRDWPLVAAQLCARGQRAPAPQEALLAQVTGAFAAAQVVVELDGVGRAPSGTSFELALPELVGRRREWSVHPQCDCTDHSRDEPPAGSPC